MSYVPKRKNRGYVYGTIVYISRLSARTAATARYLVEWEKLGSDLQKEYDDTSARTVDAVRSQLFCQY